MSFSQDTLLVFDRPGIAESPYIVGRKSVQLEVGTAYTEKTGISSSLLPTFLLRKFIGLQTELRLTMNYEPQMLGIILSNNRLDLDPLALGLKHKLFKETNWLPEAGVIVNVFYPLQYFRSRIDPINWEVNFVFQNTIRDDFSINYNLGYLVSSQFQKGVFSSSLCLTHNFSEKFGVFVEAFNYTPLREFNEYGYDLGCTYNLGRVSQIDFSIINNKYCERDYFSVMIGYAYKFIYK